MSSLVGISKEIYLITVGLTEANVATMLAVMGAGLWSVSQTQNIVTKINILLQEICDIKKPKTRTNIFSDHKTHPKGTDEGNVQDDTHLIYNSASNRLPLDTQNTLGHHAPNPNHTPSIDDNAFAP